MTNQTTTTKEALEPKEDDDPHRWEVEPHPYSTDFDYFITDSDTEARRAILEAAEMYLWDGNDGEERTLTVRMNKDIPNTTSVDDHVERARRLYAPLDTGSRVSAPIAPVVDDHRCLLCGHASVDVDGVCMMNVPTCSDDAHDWRRCGCKCKFRAAPASTVAPQQSDDDQPQNHAATCDRWVQCGDHVHYESIVNCSCAPASTAALGDEAETGGFTCDCCGRNMEVRINGKFCNECAGYRAATAPPSTLARKAAEEIAANYEVHKDRCHSNERYPLPPCDCGAIGEIAAIIERCFSAGSEK